MTLLASARVDSININADSGRVNAIKCTQFDDSIRTTELPGEGAVLALGARGLSAVMRGSPSLSRASLQLSRASTMGSIDCISCRLWLGNSHSTNSPSNVFSRFDCLRGTGGTFFALDQMHKDHLDGIHR